jgi:hypothetical protein
MRNLIIAVVVLSACSTPKVEYSAEELKNIKELDSMQKKLDSIEHAKDSIYGK